VLNKTAAVCVFSDRGRGGKGRRPGASCDSGQALEEARNGNGQLLEKVGMDLGLAPRPLGFGATPAWGGAAPVWDRRDHANSRRDKSIGLCLFVRVTRLKCTMGKRPCQ
jgi:hypothetical protein